MAIQVASSVGCLRPEDPDWCPTGVNCHSEFAAAGVSDDDSSFSLSFVLADFVEVLKSTQGLRVKLKKTVYYKGVVQ